MIYNIYEHVKGACKGEASQTYIWTCYLFLEFLIKKKLNNFFTSKVFTSNVGKSYIYASLYLFIQRSNF